jgi:hypothetical protein
MRGPMLHRAKPRCHFGDCDCDCDCDCGSAAWVPACAGTTLIFIRFNIVNHD